MRVEPLGADRRDRRYWWFRSEPRAVFVEDADSSAAAVVCDGAALEATLPRLNRKGVREVLNRRCFLCCLAPAYVWTRLHGNKAHFASRTSPQRCSGPDTLVGCTQRRHAASRHQLVPGRQPFCQYGQADQFADLRHRRVCTPR